jgi:hypothetical protein
VEDGSAEPLSQTFLKATAAMLIEAFSEAKDPFAPHTNEDRLVILPGRAYAVIDGVTEHAMTECSQVSMRR